MYKMLIPHIVPKVANFLTVHSPLIISTVIAPHGMTDLIHAYEHKKMQDLFRVNLLCIASACLGDFFHWPQVIDACFVLASIFHFRHDMPKIKNIPPYLFSALLVLNFEKIGIAAFLMYMCFIHVPNHYKQYSDLIEKHRVLTTAMISYAACVFGYITLYHPSLVSSSLMANMVKMIIVSHIVYEEVYDKKMLNKIMF